MGRESSEGTSGGRMGKGKRERSPSMLGQSGCKRERERAKDLRADDEDSIENSGPDVRRKAAVTDLPLRRRFGHAGATSSLSHDSYLLRNVHWSF